jgi:hypothetical protein
MQLMRVQEDAGSCRRGVRREPRRAPDQLQRPVEVLDALQDSLRR